jgi:hypothetical protein
MMGKDGTGSETERRTHFTIGSMGGSGRSGRWWLAPLALILAGVVVATGAIAVTQPSPRVGEEWSAISLNFGSNPLTNDLNVSFSRVAYLSQPTQWNTTGFTNATLSSTGTPWWDNSTSYGTDYGIAQFNSSDTGHYATADYHVGGSLGANVSYIFLDQRFAVNGTDATFGVGISESKLDGSSFPTSGNVTNAGATAAQNVIWLEATNSSGDVYSITVYDWEEKKGGYQTVTNYALSPAITLQPLEFYDVYVYAQPLQTVVSIVNTTDGAVLGSTAAMHPVLDGNLTSTAYLSDEVYSAGATDAMILDTSWLADHNTYTNEPGDAITSGGLAPMEVGEVSPQDVDPFDPGAASTYSPPISPSGTNSYSSTTVALDDFPTVENASTQDMMSASLLNASDLVPVNGIGSAIKDFNNTVPSTVTADQALTTWRAQGEDTSDSSSVDLYDTSWSVSQINGGIHSFLQSYVSARTGVPAADITIPSYFINSISVDTTFSDQAASTIHDYLAESIPSYLSDANLDLVNTTTGAVEAGAAIGSFQNLVTGEIYPAQAHTNALGVQSVYDPVTHQTYASASAAGFPSGSGFTAAGAIFVPDQLQFLGWNAQGQPEFGGCFIVCVSNPFSSALSGAAKAVSDFASSASNTISNSLSSISKTVDDAVIKPASGTVSSDVATLGSDVSKAVSQVMPALGGTLANVASDVSGTVTHTLSGVSSGIASVTSATAGAILGGAKSVATAMYNVGAEAGSAVETAAGDVAKGAAIVGNTVGKTLTTAAGVISNTFLSVGNAAAKAGSEALSAIGGALSSVGSTLSKIGSTVLDAIEAPFKALGSLFSFPAALSSGISAILEYVIIGIVVVVVVLLLVYFVVLRRRKRSGSGKEIGGHERGRHRVRRSSRALAWLPGSGPWTAPWPKGETTEVDPTNIAA